MPITVPTHDAEQKLAEGMRSGSREVFGQLYRHYAPALLGYISRITDDQKSSEEALQKSFVEIWNNRLDFNPEAERLFPWMLRLTKSVTLGFTPTNRYLINKKTERLFDHDITEDRSGNTDINYLNRANTMQNHLLDLMHFNNYSLDEASAILKIEENTVRSALRIAISKLKENNR